MRKLLVLGSLLAALVVAAPAQAAATTFRVSPLGTYVSPTAGTISGTATCEGGAGTITFLTTGTPYTVNGTVPVLCDGISHPWEAAITGGPYQPGQAIIFGARLVAPSGTVAQTAKVVLQ
jgi:hypothetical protein